MSETGMESEPWMDDEVLSSLAIRSEGWAREAFRRIQSQATEIKRLRATIEKHHDDYRGGLCGCNICMQHLNGPTGEDKTNE